MGLYKSNLLIYCFAKNKTMFRLYQIVSALAPKPYYIGLLCTRKNSDFGTISVMEQRCQALISKVESHILDRCL